LNAKATVKDLALPFRILISPLKTFRQLAQNPNLKGYVSLSALLVVLTATTVYAFASKIFLNINGRTSFLATDLFNSWFTSNFASTLFYIVFYWLIFASGLALISKTVGGKETSWRALFIVLGYLLSVFIILYAVRTVLYLSLPPLYFEQSSSWPPVEQVEADAALTLISQDWGRLYTYQFLTYFPLIAFAWLVILGAIAVKVLREVSWARALMVSVIGLFITLFLFGPP